MIPKPLHAVNEPLAFLLELVALAGLCWWGFHAGHNLPVHLLLGLGAPAAVIIIWARYASPRRTVKLPTAGVIAIKAAVFAAATLAMLAAHWHAWAITFAILAAANTALAAVDRDAAMNQR